MTAEPPPLHDREFDNVPRPDEAPRRERDYSHQAEYFVRLVANPFLAFFALIAWGVQIDLVSPALDNTVFVAELVLGVALACGFPFLMQYHCLDCGATGTFPRWRRHACDRVLARQRSGRYRRLRGPAPLIQVIFWIVMFVGIALGVFLNSK